VFPDVKLIRELDLVLFLPSQFQRDIEPFKICALENCLRLGMLKADDLAHSFNEQICKAFLLSTECYQRKRR
jgi:hypothetical protein